MARRKQYTYNQLNTWYRKAIKQVTSSENLHYGVTMKQLIHDEFQMDESNFYKMLKRYGVKLYKKQSKKRPGNGYRAENVVRITTSELFQETTSDDYKKGVSNTFPKECTEANKVYTVTANAVDDKEDRDTNCMFAYSTETGALAQKVVIEYDVEGILAELDSWN